MKVELRKVSDIKPYDKNPRDNDRVVEAVRRTPDPAAPAQLSLFARPEENPPLRHTYGSHLIMAGVTCLRCRSCWGTRRSSRR